ncbi:MAG: ParB/RepB/Spo0J family partition protein [Syntrophomonadaceae bacterium]
MAKRDRGLGRGLDALFSQLEPDGTENIIKLEHSTIHPNQNQPRKKFDEESLRELSESVKEHGLLQPILVRPRDHGYEIIAGERRWRAAGLAGMELVPVIVKDIGDGEAAEISLIENLQREDLNPVEEALAYKKMIEDFGYTHEAVANRIGKSRTHITNTIRILRLPEEVLRMIEDGQISAGHARSLLPLADAEQQLAAAQEIVKGKMSVRKSEEKVRKHSKRRDLTKSAEIIQLEQRLERYLGTKVEIIMNGKEGKIDIYFYSDEDLERLMELMGLMGL